MRRDELINVISERTNIKKEDVQLVLKVFQDIIKESLITEESIFLDEFGVFEPRLLPERVGEHPINGNKVVIPPMREVLFRAALNLKKELNPHYYKK